MAKPIRADDLPEDLARFAESQIAAGKFQNVEDVLRAGKEALEREQRNDARKMDGLRARLPPAMQAPTSRATRLTAYGPSMACRAARRNGRASRTRSLRSRGSTCNP